MQQEAKPIPVLDYAPRRRRFGVHLPTVIVAMVVILALNAWPHFVTTVGANTADVPEPELGWPWVFYFYGYTYAGYGPWWIPERIAYDLICAGLVAVLSGHPAYRILKRL